MSIPRDSSETDPQFYIAEDVPAFSARQAWTDILPDSSTEHRMSVGEETLRIARTKAREGLSIRTAELSAIRGVVRTGTVAIDDFRAVHSLKEQLRSNYEKLLAPDAAQYLALDYLNVLDSSVERLQTHMKIVRAAGYIAARPNLWVVTKLMPQEDGGKRISVAKLAGLARPKDEDTWTHVIPVVTGKNRIPGLLRDTHQSRAKGPRPQLLDVLESERAR